MGPSISENKAQDETLEYIITAFSKRQGMDVKNSMNLYNTFKAAGILLDLFDKRWEDFEGHRFITNENEDYPF